MQESNQDANEAKFLQSLNTLWLEYCDQMVLFVDVLRYDAISGHDSKHFLVPRPHLRLAESVHPFLVVCWPPVSAKTYTFRDAGLEIFRVAVMDCSRTRKRTLNALLNVIEAERMGTHADRQLLKSLLRMFGNLRLYDVVRLKWPKCPPRTSVS